MKALKCKPSAQFAYNYTINVLSKCSNIISHGSSKVGTSIIHLRRSTHRSLIFESRHIDLRRSTHQSLIFESRHIDLRRSTHRSSKVDTSTFDRRRSKAETSHRQPNIAPTFRQFVTKYCPLRRSIYPRFCVV